MLTSFSLFSLRIELKSTKGKRLTSLGCTFTVGFRLLTAYDISFVFKKAKDSMTFEGNIALDPISNNVSDSNNLNGREREPNPL